MDKKYNNWKKLLRQIPVSINNFYGDPLIQWEDTVSKLQELKKTKHSGPIGIITKGKITQFHAKTLSDFVKSGLKIIVLVSISELPQFEKVGTEHRYENIRILNKYSILNIAYIRPLTPPYNTSQIILDKIFKKLSNVGAKTVVASGFRGDDKLIAEMSPDKKIQWALRVKIMTKDVYKILKDNSFKYNIKFFTRTSCAISYLLGDKVTYNPYYNSPNLVHCEELNCSMRNTCKSPTEPKKHSIGFLKFLGYDVEFINGNTNIKCGVNPDNRLKCPSCCTTCFMLNCPRIVVKNKNINLGDLTFIRFVSGIISMQPGKKDDGNKDVGVVSFPNFKNISGMQCLNTWWPYARVGDTCFDCKYCIEKYYGSNRREYGFPPVQLLDKILKLNNQQNVQISKKSIWLPSTV
ncbi:MAG: hypothetical protein PHH83_00995 [Patescibacteria group bacterium]|nr:hypothetical protein [Patescibacteria group bacterium]